MKCAKNRNNVSGNTLMFKCEICHSTKLSNKVRRSVETKLDFVADGNGTVSTISLFAPQMEQYFNFVKVQLPQDDGDIALTLHQDTTNF